MTHFVPDLSVDDTLLDRYIAGECTPQEVQRVQRWLSDQSAMRNVVAQLRVEASPPDLSADADGLTMIDVDWARVRASMDGVGLPARERTITTTMRTPVNQHEPVRISHRGLWFRKPFVVAALAAGVLMAVGLGIFLPVFSISSSAGQPSRTFVTRAGERATVNLADGSYVMLGPLSTLIVTQEFGKQSRVLTLRGSGFFSVVQNSTLPFIVDAGRARVQVLGTSFGVRSYADEAEIMVAVRTGRVAIIDTLANARRQAEVPPLVASANDVARLDASGSTITRREQEAADVLAWTEGRLVFRDVPLRRVLAELSRWYTIDFRVTDPALESLPITGGFSSQSIDELPEALSFILPVRITHTGRVITIAPRE